MSLLAAVLMEHWRCPCGERAKSVSEGVCLDGTEHRVSVECLNGHELVVEDLPDVPVGVGEGLKP